MKKRSAADDAAYEDIPYKRLKIKRDKKTEEKNMSENENMSSKQLEDSDEPSVTSSPVNTDAVETSTSAQSRHDLVKNI